VEPTRGVSVTEAPRSRPLAKMVPEVDYIAHQTPSAIIDASSACGHFHPASTHPQPRLISIDTRSVRPTMRVDCT